MKVTIDIDDKDVDHLYHALDAFRSDFELINDGEMSFIDLQNTYNKGTRHLKEDMDTIIPFAFAVTREMDRNLSLHEFTPVKMSLEEYLDQKGLGSPISDFLTDKLRGNRELKTERGAKRFYTKANEQASDYAEKRKDAIQEYISLVKEGKIIPKNSFEKELTKAQGHPDNPSVQAARRMLIKRAIKQPEKIVFHPFSSVYTSKQIEQFELGLSHGLSLDEQVASFGNPVFNWEQMHAIRVGLEQGLKAKEINIFANPKFDCYQMSMLRDMVLDGIPCEKVKEYADLEIPGDALKEIKDSFESLKRKETEIERE